MCYAFALAWSLESLTKVTPFGGLRVGVLLTDNRYMVGVGSGEPR
jgi:hypothetical protein